MSEGGVLRALRGCELTETEARVYLALLRGGGGAKEISVRSKVPYTKVHTVLSSLLEKSLVTVSNDRPAVYSARSVVEGLSEYRAKVQKGMEEAFRRAEQALMTFQGEPEKSDIWIIRSAEEMLVKAYNMLRISKKDVRLALPVLPKGLIEGLLPVLTRLKGQDAEINVLVTKEVGDTEVRKLSEVSKVRRRDKMFGGGLIVDNSEIMLFIGGNEGVMDTALWANHPGLVQLAIAYFDFLWAGSEAP